MPIMRECLDNNHIFLYRVFDPCSVDEILPLMTESKAIRDLANHTIHTLVNLSQVSAVPVGVIRMRTSPDLTHPTSGYLAATGASPLFQSIVMTIANLARFRTIRFFDTEAEGLAFLRDKIQAETAVESDFTRLDRDRGDGAA